MCFIKSDELCNLSIISSNASARRSDDISGLSMDRIRDMLGGSRSTLSGGSTTLLHSAFGWKNLWLTLTEEMACDYCHRARLIDC